MSTCYAGAYKSCCRVDDIQSLTYFSCNCHIFCILTNVFYVKKKIYQLYRCSCKSQNFIYLSFYKLTIIIQIPYLKFKKCL